MNTPDQPAPPPRPTVRVVCATRLDRDAFYAQTLLGRSLAAMDSLRNLEVELTASNRRGLPSVYNEAIKRAAARPALLVFAHDDVQFCDFYWDMAIDSALAAFDLVGVAGCRRRVPRQAGWNLLDERLAPVPGPELSGVFGQGAGFPDATLRALGPPGQPVALLAGCLLAARSRTLVERGLRFDERFTFNFYATDLCRSAQQAGLRLGTWWLSVVHGSAGGAGSDAWHAAYRQYLEKWHE